MKQEFNLERIDEMKKFLLVAVGFSLLLVGWFLNDLCGHQKAYAQKSVVYEVVYAGIGPPYTLSAKLIETTMNEHAKQGWKVLAFTNEFVVFER